MKAISSTFTRQPPAEVPYRCDGDGGPALLFFNGASLPLQFWDPLIEHLTADHTCIRFDQRNAPASTYSGSFTLPDVAADAAALLQHLHVERCIIVGHAWGGRVAQVFARDYPHLCDAIVICGTGGQLPAHTNPETLKRMAQAMRDDDRDTWAAALAATFCGADFPAAEPAAFNALTDLLWRQRANRNARWDAAVCPSSSYWGQAHMPACLIYGDQDRNGTPDNARDLHAQLPTAELHFIEGAGHFVVREAVAQVAALVRGFVATHQAPQG
ncbi:MAG: alpha/beta hydrolase [Pseudomonadota bacterium]